MEKETPIEVALEIFHRRNGLSKELYLFLFITLMTDRLTVSDSSGLPEAMKRFRLAKVLLLMIGFFTVLKSMSFSCKNFKKQATLSLVFSSIALLSIWMPLFKLYYFLFFLS